MNAQKAPMGIEWTRIPYPDGSFRRGFTWNPIAGCLYEVSAICSAQLAG